MSYALLEPTLVPASALLYLQWSSIVIGALSKLPQIISNIRSGNTGQLSIITVFLQFAGSAARVFTTLREVADQAILTSFLISSTLNGILFLQVVVYGGQKSGKSSTAKGKKNAAAPAAAKVIQLFK